ncbi:MAG TPA: hypothetical protein VFM71_13785 [Gemmatimonadaceae bacterium]|nr:hypothetical protein [Gemmatimonadaceae bacterium]
MDGTALGGVAVMGAIRYPDPTPEQLARRAYARRHAAKCRAAKLAAANQHARTCTHREGPHGRCGGLLEDRVVNGRVVRSCPRCARRKAGICRDCPRPVYGQVGKALRCAACKARSVAMQTKKSEAAHRAEKRARARELWLAMPAEERERRAILKRAWRKAHPDKVKAQKRREALRQSPHARAYHQRYREARKGQRSAVAMGHACLGCGEWIPRGRAKKCGPCRQRTRDEARALLRSAGWAA